MEKSASSELSARGIAPSEEKIAAVVNAGPRQNVIKVWYFVKYSVKFIPDFRKSQSLYDAC